MYNSPRINCILIMIVSLRNFTINYFKFIRNCSLPKFLFTQFPVLIIISFIINSILYFIFGNDTDVNHFTDNSFIFNFFFIVVAAPWIETIIFQYLPYLILSTVPIIKSNNYLIIFISSLFFGITHTYSTSYIFYAFFMGVILMGFFIVRLKKEDSFMAVFIIHMLVNGLGFLGETLYPV